MQLYQTVFELIDLRSFSNLWFWIALAVMWSSASHRVLGVPFDLITRARRQGGEAEQDVIDMLRANRHRMLYISRVAGLWLTGFGFGLMAALVMLGFYYWIEFAQALFLLAAPMTVVGLLNLSAMRRLERDGAEGPALYRRLIRHRLKVQGIGMVSIFVTAMWGMWQNFNIGAL
ncbi:MAG: component of SufBCD complex [Paracoccaceae bacterium]|nr:component of SufBCD complex [Paracoccaceae bacterium]